MINIMKNKLKTKEEILNSLRGTVFLKLRENENDEKLQAIMEVLKNDNCFADLTVNAAYDILKYLNVDDSEIPILYATILTNQKVDPEFYLIDISNQEKLSIIGEEQKIILNDLYKLFEKKKQKLAEMNEIDKIKMVFLKYFLNPNNKTNPFVGLGYNFICDILKFLEVDEAKFRDYYLKLSRVKELVKPLSQIEKIETLWYNPEFISF